MMLKVGELAKRTRLTVRTLHHYDEIGLLKPSGRSDSGYRLYSQADVARLHGIQALRHLGLALGEIAGMLDGGGASPALILEQQMRALDHQIEQATQLRDRLGVMQVALAQGSEPTMADWLETLALMTTYGKYFSAAELKTILGNWKLIEPAWIPLTAAVRAAMDRGLPPEAPEVQPLAQRWMSLMLRWMDNDFALVERWGDMYDKEPAAQRGEGAPQRDMVEFIRRAMDLRMAALARYLQPDEMRCFRYVPEQRWQELARRVDPLMEAGVPPQDAQLAAIVRDWLALLDDLAGGRTDVRDKWLQAVANEPLLRAGSTFGRARTEYLHAALANRLTLT